MSTNSRSLIFDSLLVSMSSTKRILVIDLRFSSLTKLDPINPAPPVIIII